MATMAVGAVFTVAGAFGLLVGGDPEPASEAPAPIATTGPATSTTASTTTTALTTTEAPSTTEPPTTSTTLPNPADVESFVDQFVEWIAASAVDALVGRLHPVVIEEYGQEVCRSFVEREILALEDYRSTGPVTGPDPSQFGSVDIDVYRMPVAFTFQGEEFASDAAFAFEDGVVHWFATCR